LSDQILSDFIKKRKNFLRTRLSERERERTFCGDKRCAGAESFRARNSEWLCLKYDYNTSALQRYNNT